MTTALIAALLSAAAAPTPYAGFEQLTAKDGVSCTWDARICVSVGEAGVVTVTRDGKETASWTPDADGGDVTFTPMPALLRLDANRVLVGILGERQSSYSGGGGSATEQVLTVVEPGKAPRTVLTAPGEGSLMIRACFSEKDAKRRAGACHDEYRFAGYLTAAATASHGLPELGFRMESSHYPRGVSRDGDSLALPPLRKADLTWEDDARCTYRRTFRFDEARGAYVPDAPLPDCADYTQP